MIKPKTILILVGLLVVLGVVSFLQKSSHKKETSRPTTTVLIEGQYGPADLGSISLGYGPDLELVVLANTPEGWVLDSAWNAAASTQRVEGLLNNLANLAGEFRSDAAGVVADYGLSEDKSVKIRLYDPAGELVAALDLGVRPERSPGNFVKRPGESAVYLIQKNLLASMGLYGGPEKPFSKHFLELQAVKDDRQDVDRIVLEDGSTVTELLKEFTPAEPAAAEAAGPGVEGQPAIDRSVWEWQIVRPNAGPALKTKADAIMGAVTSIRAIDVADPAGGPAEYGLAKPTRVARVVRLDGSERVLRFGGSREADGDVQAGTWLQVDGDPTIWVVTEYSVNNIFKPAEELVAE